MASWDDPTGEHPVEHTTGRTEQVATAPQVRGRSALDRVAATAFIAVLVVAVAVGAFLYGRSRIDHTVNTTPSVSSSAPIVLPDSTTTSTTLRRGATTTSTTTPAPSDPVVVATVPAAPVTTAPHPPPTTATTVPATTATTAPPAPANTGDGNPPTP